MFDGGWERNKGCTYALTITAAIAAAFIFTLTVIWAADFFSKP